MDQDEEDDDGCRPNSATGRRACRRIVIDDFASKEEIDRLRLLAEKGASKASPDAIKGGPTIVDVNTGFVRDPNGVTNLYEGPNVLRFDRDELETYRRVMERIRDRVAEEFNATGLYLTAPTFVTREIGSAEHDWRPKSPHDEYFHPHVDKNNTAHYDYSGLLYLSDYATDFRGGLFAFLDGRRAETYVQERPCYDDDILAAGAPHDCAAYAAAGFCPSHPDVADACPASCGTCVRRPTFSEKREESEWRRRWAQDAHVVEPKRGRLVVFSAGRENLHLVREVSRGTRWVMSMWFTCDPTRTFDAFLDGRAHRYFNEATADEGREEL